DEHALALRSVPQAELLQRLRADFDKMMAEFEGLSAADWAGFMPPHGFMGPLPAFFFPTFHLVDYGVHGWDIREGLGMANGLSGDVADLLAPIMFILWQATTLTERVGGEPIRAGVRVSGRNGGLWRVTVTDDGYAFERLPADAATDDLPVVLDFDPGSLVLTAYGRIHGGTAYGDRALADRYRGLFHSI
ncbi:MAG TPA: maleylpyruvate isomerase N-terminal domain-containing protein, partial [Thermomicrobiales bacterium]|nr:maleylpyruvate isomerase N-terminal domain-containing protein [Thermomicrobiales bacterium]